MRLQARAKVSHRLCRRRGHRTPTCPEDCAHSHAHSLRICRAKPDAWLYGDLVSRQRCHEMAQRHRRCEARSVEPPPSRPTLTPCLRSPEGPLRGADPVFQSTRLGRLGAAQSECLVGLLLFCGLPIKEIFRCPRVSAPGNSPNAVPPAAPSLSWSGASRPWNNAYSVHATTARVVLTNEHPKSELAGRARTRFPF